MSSTVLITGGAGFIGSNLIRYLLENRPQIQIVNLDKLTYAGNLENLKDVEEKEGYTFLRGDICQADLIFDLFEKWDFDTVFHLAAESHVDRSILGPQAFIKTNIEGTFNLLEGARKHWGGDVERRFVHVSTDEVYGSLGKTGYFREDSRFAPNSPYSASKASADHLVRAYHRTYNLPVIITNCCNNYGPYQFPEKLIPLMIQNALKEEPLPVYGDGMQVRDWIHVADHCRALDLVWKKGQVGETYCVGTRCEVANLKIVKMILAILKKPESLIRHVEDRPGHDRRYAIDPAKLEALGFRGKYDLKEGLERTVNWYLSHGEWMESVTSGEYKKYYQDQYENRLEEDGEPG